MQTASSIGSLFLTWSRGEDPCEWPGDYGIYQGVLGDFDSHAPVVCSPFVPIPDLFHSLDAGPGDAYFFPVAHNGASEGSYGTTSAGVERGQGAEACRPQRVEDCE